MVLGAAVLLKSHFKQVGAHQEGISLSILYLNIDRCPMFMKLLRTKLVLLGCGIINFF